MTSLLSAGAFALVGAATGHAHLASLKMGVRALMGGRRSIWDMLAAFARFPATLTAFVFGALHGAPPLCAMLCGFVIVKTFHLARAERT